MPAILMKLLTSATGVLGTSAAILALLLAVQSARLHHAKTDLSHARRANVDSVTGRTWRSEAEAETRVSATLAASLDKQSHALVLLKAAQERANDASNRALVAAEAIGDRDRVAARRILQLKAGGDLCASADAIIIKSLGGGSP